MKSTMAIAISLAISERIKRIGHELKEDEWGSMRSVEKIKASLFSIKRSMAFDITGRYHVATIAFIAVRGIAVSSSENRIFMDWGISHIQHITRINGIARRRTRSLVISRRAALSDEAHGDNRCKSPQFDRGWSTKVSCDTCTFQNSEYRSAFVYSRRVQKLWS